MVEDVNILGNVSGFLMYGMVADWGCRVIRRFSYLFFKIVILVLGSMGGLAPRCDVRWQDYIDFGTEREGVCFGGIEK